MYLKKVDIKEFREVIYPEYEKIFPEIERKSYANLKKSYDKNIVDMIEIIEEDQFVGFFIVNFLKNNLYQDYDGIYIEIEKIGNGDNEEENKIRQRRAKFYENLGFVKLEFDIELFTALFSTYMLPCSKKEFFNEEVIEGIFSIYNAILGEEKAKKYCKVIR